jgi:hypothetical protein
MRLMAGNGSEVVGMTAHSSSSLLLACVGVLEHALRLLEHALRLLALACWSTPYACFIAAVIRFEAMLL